MKTARKRMGWRNNHVNVTREIGRYRLETCPIESVREKLSITDHHGLKADFEYHEGMETDEEKACVMWIMTSRMPMDNKLCPETADLIFDWIRETINVL